MFISKKGSVYYRRLRRDKLMLSLDKVGESKMHSGAGNAEEYVFSFDDAYNNPRIKEKVGYTRTKGQIRAKSDIELEQAKNLLVEACRHCEFYPCAIAADADITDPTVREEFRHHRRKIFWSYHDSELVRTRIRDRLSHKDVVSGAKSAPCAVLVRPGRLKKTDWTYS